MEANVKTLMCVNSSEHETSFEWNTFAVLVIYPQKISKRGITHHAERACSRNGGLLYPRTWVSSFPLKTMNEKQHQDTCACKLFRICNLIVAKCLFSSCDSHCAESACSRNGGLFSPKPGFPHSPYKEWMESNAKTFRHWKPDYETHFGEMHLQFLWFTHSRFHGEG